MGYVSNPGGGGGGFDPNLVEDAYAEADPITDYPDGISIMPVSDTASWNGNGEAASVVTEHTANGGSQQLIYQSGWEEIRWWNEDGTPDWEAWTSFATGVDIAATGYTLKLRPTDEVVESSLVASFASGMTIMPVTAGANWGPNTGEAGLVTTTNIAGTNGVQHFVQYSNNTEYRRIYASGSWSSWVNIAT